jgi:hypothetical protein
MKMIYYSCGYSLMLGDSVNARAEIGGTHTFAGKVIASGVKNVFNYSSLFKQ